MRSPYGGFITITPPDAGAARSSTSLRSSCTQRSTPASARLRRVAFSALGSVSLPCKLGECSAPRASEEGVHTNVGIRAIDAWALAERIAKAVAYGVLDPQGRELEAFERALLRRDVDP